MKVRKNAKPCYDPMCDRCDRHNKLPSTHRVQITEDCIWMWLCDDHTNKVIADNKAYEAVRNAMHA